MMSAVSGDVHRALAGRDGLDLALFQWLRFACHWQPSSAPGGAQRTYWAKRVKARKQIVVITVNP